MKRRNFLVCLFYCFFRLPICESIAAIFWQSASYVWSLEVAARARLLRWHRLKERKKCLSHVTTPYPYLLPSINKHAPAQLFKPKYLAINPLSEKKVRKERGKRK